MGADGKGFGLSKVIFMADRIAQLKAILDVDPNDVFCLYGMGMEHDPRQVAGTGLALCRER